MSDAFTVDGAWLTLMFPVFVALTEPLVPYIQFADVELLVIAIFGGVLSGLGYGLIFKTNFNTGGTDILCEIVAKYTKVSLGKAMWVSDGIVVLSGLLVSSWEVVLYGFLVLYIISFMTDRVVLGISQSKAFYIVTKKGEMLTKLKSQEGQYKTNIFLEVTRAIDIMNVQKNKKNTWG